MSFIVDDRLQKRTYNTGIVYNVSAILKIEYSASRMKIFKLIMVLSLIFSSISAHAEDVRVLGSGIVNKANTEAIVLVCVDNCIGAQFMHLVRGETLSMEPISDKMILPVSNDPELRSKAIQLQIQLYMEARVNDERSKNSYELKKSIFEVGFWIGIPLISGAVATASPLVLIPAVTLPITGLFLLLFGSNTRNIDNALAGTGRLRTIEKSGEQEGWNWASHPHRMRQKHFNELISKIHQNYRTVNFTGHSEYEKILAKIHKLSEKGVIFDRGINYY